ncbi:response regulator transcription factor [Baekduia soli]|uniref:response regulator transcription factor n=1 Tax=Baekduia soli TaxID=496014 RepID=UPI0016525EE1|nr:response regulator transcription factor [Baekduia soli]
MALGGRAMSQRVEDTLARQGIDVVACVEDLDELEELSTTCHPHVLVLLDGSGHDPAATIRALWAFLPRTRVVMTLRDHRAAAVREALKAGADGVVLESQLAMSLAAVVRAVSLGHAVVPLTDRSVLGRQPLTTREREVLELAADGLTNVEIGTRLHLAESTIKSHLSSGFSKLGVRSRSELPALIREGREYRPAASRTTAHLGGNA